VAGDRWISTKLITAPKISVVVPTIAVQTEPERQLRFCVVKDGVRQVQPVKVDRNLPRGFGDPTKGCPAMKSVVIEWANAAVGGPGRTASRNRPGVGDDALRHLYPPPGHETLITRSYHSR